MGGHYRCETCGKTAIYGKQGERPSRCKAHILPEQTNLNDRRCETCGKIATYGFPGAVCTRCPNDRLDGMVTGPTRHKVTVQVTVENPEPAPPEAAPHVAHTGGVASETSAELCKIFGVESPPRVRIVGEGVDRKYSLVDVARL